MAALIVELERNPIPAKLFRGTPSTRLPFLKLLIPSPFPEDNVYYDTLVCTAAHSSNVPKDLRKTILKSIESDRALSRVETLVLEDSNVRALIGTTTAVDITGGGVKVLVLWLVNPHFATYRRP